MSLKRDLPPLTSPSLISLFGGTDRKARPLDREVVTLGRARGSDFCLDANEVSALHAVIYRASDGFRVRDCGSRTGTRVNGNPVKNAVLSNGDVLNIGPFSFEMRVPPEYDTSAAALSPVVVDKLRRSRAKLARRALKLRARLRQARAGSAVLRVSESTADLRAKAKQQEQRIREMEDAEMELEEERQNLAKEQEAYRQRVQQIERDIEARLRQADEKIKAEWQNFQQRVHEQESASEKRQSARVPATMIGSAPAVSDDNDHRQQQLDDAIAAFELEREAFAQQKAQAETEAEDNRAHLERQRQTLAKAEESLRQQKEQIAKMIGDLKKLQEEVRRTQKGDSGAAEAELRQLRQALAQAEAKAAEPRVDPEAVAKLQATAEENNRLHQTIAELERRLQDAAASEDIRTRLEETLNENDRLRIIAIELEQQLASAQMAPAPTGDAELAQKVSHLESENELLHRIVQELKNNEPAAPPADGDLRQENELLRKLLQEKDQLIDEIARGQQPSQANDSAEAQARLAELDKLAAENESLRALLQEKSEILEHLKADQGVGAKDENDLATYEAELNRYRHQLEKDRNKLNEELESVRERNAEMDETIREMEMQMSRERAEMARERQRLDRMREEIKLEVEHLQRDNGMRESLAGVQKLRDELNARPNPQGSRAGTQPPAAPPARALNERLAGLRPNR